MQEHEKQKELNENENKPIQEQEPKLSEDFKFDPNKEYVPNQGIPKCDKLTAAMILVFRLRNQINVQTDDKQRDYQLGFFEVTFSANINGQIREWIENYGGIKIYSDGEIYIGPQSAAGELLELVRNNKPWKGDLKDLHTYMQNQKVGIQTKTTKVGTKEYTKNKIMQFAMS